MEDGNCGGKIAKGNNGGGAINSGTIVMAVAMNGSCGNGRRQWWRQDRNGQQPRQQNGSQDGGTMAMWGVVMPMDSGGGDGLWRGDGNLTGDGNCNLIAMGDGGSGAMDRGITAQS